MPYISRDKVKEARKIDALTYLSNYEPNELIQVGNNTYSTKTHDSMRISNGLWNWFSRGIGGKSAIDYLMSVEGYSFTNAVQKILENTQGFVPNIYENYDKKQEKKLILPDAAINNIKAIFYLRKRGIDNNIIQECIKNKMIYEEKNCHNCVFVGYDKNKNPKYAFCRGTTDKRFMQEVKGSDKNYTFRLESNSKSNRIHLFESAIDLLSYATLLKIKNIDWHNENMLSLGGVYQTKTNQKNIKVPNAIKEYLKENPNIKEIYLHLDNDEVGRNASKDLINALGKEFKVFDRPVPKGKDCNDYLCYVLGIKNFNKNTKEITKKQEKIK